MSVSEREISFDVLRGACVVSMVVSHVGGTYLDGLTHWPRWIDGAMGFVLISGVVVGLVQKTVHDRAGPRPATALLLRRALLLYGIHVALTLLALTAYALIARPGAEPSVAAQGGWSTVLARVLTLQVQVAWLNILSLYAVLLATAPVGAMLLARGRPGALAMLSLAVYLLSLVAPDATMPRVLQDSREEFNWGGWQALFVAGLVVGWYWRAARLSERLRRPPLVVPSVVVCSTCLVVSQLALRTDTFGGVVDPAPRVFAKWDLGPLTIVWALALFVVGYAVVRSATQWRLTATVWRALALLGRRALDAFVILGIAVIGLPTLGGTRPAGEIGDLHTVAVLAVITVWAVARERHRLRGSVRQHRRASTVDAALATVAVPDALAGTARQASPSSPETPLGPVSPCSIRRAGVMRQTGWIPPPITRCGTAVPGDRSALLL